MEEYIKEQYKIAESDYKFAHGEEEKQDALKRMHRLKLLASEKVGFEFSDSLGNSSAPLTASR